MSGPENQAAQPAKPTLDLSDLQNLSLGPAWGSDKPKSATGRPERKAPSGDEGETEAAEERAARKDRRGQRFQRRPREERAPAAPPPPFVPVVNVAFYPDDAAFKALTQAIRNSFRTFELFEIARLILEKPERFTCVVRPLDKGTMLHVSVPDGLPFLSEQEALEHVYSLHMANFFDVQEVEVDPPAGNFQVINRCGITGELLGPPNYHRYAALVQEHRAHRLPHISAERFQQRVESVREQEVIDAWLNKMRKQQRYVLKGTPEGEEPKVMDSLESARLYLLMNAKEQVVRQVQSARFLGREVLNLPLNHPIRRSVEMAHMQQSRFPLDTANQLRGRLRRLGFAVYKRGSKGVSYVCAVKRRFRTPTEVLADNLNDLIHFIEAHPNILASDLPREYLGITPPAQPAAEGAPDLPAEDKDKLSGLRRDLRYLVSQGYVIEYSNGSLFVPPVREENSEKDEDGDDKEAASVEESRPEAAGEASLAEAPASAGQESAPEEDKPSASVAGASPTPGAEEPTPPVATASPEEAPAPEPTPVSAGGVSEERSQPSA